MPPSSALRFANQSASLMSKLYGNNSQCFSADNVGQLELEQVDHIVFWGIDARTVNQLIKSGIPQNMLPDGETIAQVRQLQHRSTGLSLQNTVDSLWGSPTPISATRQEEIEEFLSHHPDIVLKSPWSGAGRGLRWVRNQLSAHDESWAHKILQQQGTVMVEPRRIVLQDFALEFWVAENEATFLGYSLFSSKNGVYQSNEIISDDQIKDHLYAYSTVEKINQVEDRVAHWIRQNIVTKYVGPLGVDLYVDDQGLPHVSEINVRHTMGMLAVADASGKNDLLVHFLK